MSELREIVTEICLERDGQRVYLRQWRDDREGPTGDWSIHDSQHGRSSGQLPGEAWARLLGRLLLDTFVQAHELRADAERTEDATAASELRTTAGRLVATAWRSIDRIADAAWPLDMATHGMTNPDQEARL